MHAKHIVIQLEKAECEIFLHLVPKTRVDFVSSNVQGVTLQFQIDRGIVVPDIGHIFNAGNPVGGDVSMLEGQQGNIQSYLIEI